MKKVLVVAALALIIIAAVGFFSWTRTPGNAGEAERNRAFTQAMAGLTLVGNSVRDGREGLSRQERYRIDSVTHVGGDAWLFRTRLQYRDTEVPIPIPLKVQWAGDTPVITLTDLTIPGLGTYTARVVLYRDQYAGTWGGKNVGGQLFGKILHGESR